jgi:hypothetical protein
VNGPGKSQAVKIEFLRGTPFQRERDSDRGVGKLTDLENLRSRGRQETCFAVGGFSSVPPPCTLSSHPDQEERRNQGMKLQDELF